MKVIVETNSNVLFFQYLITNLQQKQSEPLILHELGMKLLKSLPKIKDIKSFQLLSNLYKEKQTKSNEWFWLQYAIYTNEELEVTELGPKYGFGPNTSKHYIEVIQPLVKDIFDRLKFKELYEENILKEYVSLCKKIEEEINKYDFLPFLISFWKSPETIKHIFVPNLMSIGNGHGIAFPGKYFSIRDGYLLNDTNKVDFPAQKIILNCIHEFSHSYFHDKLIESGKYEMFSDLCKKKYEEAKNSMSEEYLKHYGSGDIYFEENFIRAVTIILQNKVFPKINLISDIDAKQKKEIQILKLEEQGFKYIRNFSETILKNIDRDKVDLCIDMIKSI